MSRSLSDILDELTGLPSGGAENWKRRYEPLIEEVVRHRDVTSPTISAIVVGWKSAAFILDSLDAIADQHGIERDEVEIVLVDNGGLDEVRDGIARRADLEIRMRGNVRLCRARNTGVAWAGGDLIAFIDDDGIIAPDYFDRALPYFQSDKVAGIRSRIVADKHPYFTTLAGHYDRGDEPLEDCLVTEGSSVLRRQPYIDAGGFAESLAGHEGIDLTFRLKQVDPDWRILYAPDVVMAHDYFDGWSHFIEKSLNYADIDQEVRAERPELGDFLDDYFTWDFPPPERELDEAISHVTLRFIRDTLELTSRLSSFVGAGEPRNGEGR